MTILYIFIALIILEVVLQIVVQALRTRFPWLITPEDAQPNIPDEEIRKHCSQSFHSKLGWLPRPNESWQNSTSSGDVTYNIDTEGRRSNLMYQDSKMPIAVYGDSYAFCRLVADSSTWPYYLSEKLDCHVGNYGVGNYGIDQALLRYEEDQPEVKVVIIAIVPETIARIQSCWKHYFEYGNVLAFKPRFYLDGGLLKGRPSPIEKESDYSKYKDNIKNIRDFDGFYFRKFKKDILKFPILFSLLRRPFRHIPIIYYLIVGILTKNFEKGYSNAFKEILKENARWVHKLYREPDSLNLLRKIIERFIESSCSRGLEPLLVIIPQPSDTKRNGAEAHESFFSEMEEKLPVLDFTKLFKAEVDIDELYVDGPLGPHTSPRANQLIANTLANKIESMNWTTET